MAPPPLVLDTNVFRGEALSWFSDLHAKGFTLRISEVALLETWAASTRAFHEGCTFRAARGVLFSRAKAVAPYLAREDPVLVVGPPALDSIRQRASAASGLPAPLAQTRRQWELNVYWTNLIKERVTTAQWLEGGRVANKHLEDLDKNVIGLARTDADFTEKPPLPPLDVDTTTHEYAAALEEWHVRKLRARLPDLVGFISETLELPPEAAERLDCYVRGFAFRLAAASTGARLPKKNDGADLRLPMHIAQGHVLVTKEPALLGIVDECETNQACWVRAPDDLDRLPEGEPWGNDLAAAHAAFTARGRRG